MEAVATATDSIDRLYVLDGHHRLAAASRCASRYRAENVSHCGDEPYNFIPAALFPQDQLRIYEYNRVVTDLGDRSVSEFLAMVAGAGFRVERMPRWKASTARPTARGQISMRLDRVWYRLTTRDVPAADPLRSLDVTLLHERILKPLGIDDARSDPRIAFVPGTLGLDELERLAKGEYRVAFALHPTQLEDLMAVADRGQTMPPKSTWVAPKLQPGLIVRLLDRPGVGDTRASRC